MRNVSETREEALQQLELGLSGQNISKRQTATGVKDGIVTSLLQGTPLSTENLDADVIADVNFGIAVDISSLPIEDKINPALTLDSE